MRNEQRRGSRAVHILTSVIVCLVIAGAVGGTAIADEPPRKASDGRPIPTGGCEVDEIIYDAEGMVYGCVGGGNWCANSPPKPGVCLTVGAGVETAPTTKKASDGLTTIPTGGCESDGIVYDVSGKVWGCVGGGNWCANAPAKPGVCSSTPGSPSTSATTKKASDGTTIPEGGCEVEEIVYDAKGSVHHCVGGGNWCANAPAKPGVCQR